MVEQLGEVLVTAIIGRRAGRVMLGRLLLTPGAEVFPALIAQLRNEGLNIANSRW